MRSLTVGPTVFLLLASADALAQPCSPSPDLLIVLDRSGSMTEAAGFESKWSAAKKAVTALATGYENALRLGLSVFPYGYGSCGTGSVVARIPSTAATISGILGGTFPSGGTPMSVSLAAARTYLQGLNDGRAKYVLLITDGMPNCQPSCLSCLDAQNAVNAVSALSASGYKTFVVGFGSGVDPTTLNRMASAGGTARAGATRYYSASDQATLTAALNAIATNLNAKKSCQGPCGPGEQLCRNDGTFGPCTATPIGAVQPCHNPGPCGTANRTCTASGWTSCQTPSTGATRPCRGPCGPGVETCRPDGWDTCSTSAGAERPCQGACGPGLMSCRSNGWSACSTAAGETRTCQGSCGPGVSSCGPTGWKPCSTAPGATRPCQGACGPGLEICKPTGWGACSAAEGSAQSCTHECGNGTQECAPGGWTTCASSGITNACGKCGDPPSEVCDGKDNDCNGLVDEGAFCANGKCIDGACRKVCTASGGELGPRCASGERCVEGHCLPSDCAGVKCPTGHVCKAGACADPCTGVTCAPGRVCRGGACVESSCYTLGCPAGKRCTKGACAADPCASVTCGKGAFCREGACVKSCAGIACGPGESCADGACVKESCEGGCLAPLVCDKGVCSGDPCTGVVCGAGRACVRGACEDDPCRSLTCPSSEDVCKRGQCYLPTDAAVAPAPAPVVVETQPGPPAGDLSDLELPDETVEAGKQPAPAATPRSLGCSHADGGSGTVLFVLLAASLLVASRRRSVVPQRIRA